MRYPPAYWEGSEAAGEGLGPEANPYDREKQYKLWVWWRRGWIGWSY